MSLTPSQLAAQPQQLQVHIPSPRPGTSASASAALRIKRCPSCGLMSGVDSFFCTHCGADISLERSEPQQVVAQDFAGELNGEDSAPPDVAAPAAAKAAPELDKLRAAAAAAIPLQAPRASQPPQATVPPGPAPAGKQCPQCSHDNPGYAFLCLSCGADLSLDKAGGSAVAAPIAEARPQAPAIDRTTRVPPPIPGTLARSAVAAASGAPPRLQLLIGSKSFDCHDGDVLGRAGTLASDLFAPFGTVSRHHASIILQNNRWFIVPSPSGHNATRLDGQELKRGEPTPLTGEHLLGLSTKCEVKLRVVPG